MLSVYLACLLVGGVFVGLTAFAGGHDHDHDADVDHDLDVDHDIDIDVDHDVDVDIDHDLDLDVDVDHDIDVDHDVAIDLELDAGVGGSGGNLADDAQAVGEGAAGKRHKRLWLPVYSLRFWTFGAAFFGLTGVLLTTLTEAGEPLGAGLAAAFGVVAGAGMATLARQMRKPVTADAIRMSDYPGQLGELVLPLREGGRSRIRIQIRHRERELIARTESPQALPKGSRVVILSLDEEGHAVVAPEGDLYRLER